MAEAKNASEEQLASARDTVESIWIAIVLAFVLRAFVLEAFMIPTGSMAPRLMGKHWQFDCPACGYHYAYGIDAPGRDVDISRKLRGPQAQCPNCGHVLRFEEAEWAFGGDRVLVLKYLYRFREPQPWDVVVFKNPLNNQENYIKRLIGLPGQMIEIVHGDVFFRQGKDLNGDRTIDEKDFADPRAAEECPWQILRKSPETQEVMWQIIFDSDYPPDPEVYKGEDSAWQSPWRVPSGRSSWNLDARGRRVFLFSGAEGPAELRFRPPGDRFFPNYAYNNPDRKRYDPLRDINYDLKLSFLFVPKAADARVGLHLSSFADHFRAWLGADGAAVLTHGVAGKDGRVVWDADERRWGSIALKPLEVGQGHDLALTHVDHRVTLWLDGQAVLASNDKRYRAEKDEIIETVERTLEEHPEGLPLPTVGILAEGGPAELWHVKLVRDVFYTCPPLVRAGDVTTNYRGWGTTGNPKLLRRFRDLPDLDEFFVLGDNSPASKDSRMWGYHAPTLRQGYVDGTVPRYNMIGKAFFVYWPGGYRPQMIPRLPIVPNVGRMRLIR